MAAQYSAAIIGRVAYRVTDNYVGMGVIAVVLYEYLATFGTEVHLFWGRNVTGASILFFINRYTRLLYTLFSILHYSPFMPCSGKYLYTRQAFLLINYIPWAGFSALRVFALTGGNWLLAPAVFMLSLGPVILNFAAFNWMRFHYDPINECIEILDLPTAVYIKLVIASRGSLIVADLIVIIVTWVTTYKAAIAARSVLNRNQPTFSALLLRDGTFYFIIVLSLNILQLAFSTSDVLKSLLNGELSFIPVFSDPLTSILIARFMMNLQEAKRATTGSTGASRSVSLIQFDRVIGSIGEQLGPSIADYAAEDEAEE